MSNDLLREAFKDLDMVGDNTFDLDKKGIDELQKFLDGDYISDVEYIIDPDAENEDELEDSYVNKVVLDCDVCHSLIYKDQDNIVIDEETEMANVGEECPYCQSTEGFKIIGQVAPYGEDACECEDEHEEEEIDDEFEETEDEESFEESYKRNKKGLNEADKPEFKTKKKKMINLWDRVMGLLDGTDLDYVRNAKTGKLRADHSKALYQSDDIGIDTRNNCIFIWVADEKDTEDAQKIADKYNLKTKLGKPEMGVRGPKNRRFFIYVDPNKMILDDHDARIINERMHLKLAKKSLKEGTGESSAYFPTNRVEFDTDFNKAYENAVKRFHDTDDFEIDLDYLDEAIELGDWDSQFTFKEYLDAQKTSKRRGSDLSLDDFIYNIIDRIIDSGDYDAIIEEHGEEEFDESYRRKSNRSIKEDFQKISIENKDNITTVDTDEDGKTTVTTEPKKDKSFETPTEVIKPLPAEVKAEIEGHNEEEEELPDEVDVDIEEIDEEDFDNLGESYLKRVYDNIQSYKTTSGRLNENKIMLEGILTFKSGKQVKTNFIFESHYQTKTGKLKFLGENVQISPRKGAFTLTGSVDGKKLLAESLTYKYNGKDAKTGKTTSLYGTVKNIKRSKKD